MSMEARVSTIISKGTLLILTEIIGTFDIDGLRLKAYIYSLSLLLLESAAVDM